jgi:hypothetical protein
MLGAHAGSAAVMSFGINIDKYYDGYNY